MSRAKFRLRRGDRVRVIAGKDKGKEGEIMEVLPGKARVMVRDVNILTKAKRPTQNDPSGGFEHFEGAIHISNVQLLDPKTGELSRIGYGFDENGNKIRISRKSGVKLD